MEDKLPKMCVCVCNITKAGKTSWKLYRTDLESMSTLQSTTQAFIYRDSGITIRTFVWTERMKANQQSLRKWQKT